MTGLSFFKDKKSAPVWVVTALIVTMAIATFVEKNYGSATAYATIYGSWWFAGLWAILAGLGVVGICKGRLYKHLFLLLLHLSFILILAGALCTKLFARQGYVALHSDKVCREMQMDQTSVALPFTLQLDTFYVDYYPGTDAPADYVSRFSICDDDAGNVVAGSVSMNRIFSYRGYRFYQSSFAEEGRVSVLSLNRDVWGIPLTYAGYALFVVSMLGFLLSPKSAFRQLLSHPALKKAAMVGLLLLPVSLHAGVLTKDSLSISKPHAADFGRLWMLYNGRIAPLATFAHDFTLKVTGKTSFAYLDANQFLAGCLFFPDRWQHVALFEVKDPELKRLLNAETERAALTDFYDSEGNYKLSAYWKDLSRNASKSSRLKEVEKLNDKVQAISMLHSGSVLQLYPQEIDGHIRWFYPTQDLPTAEEQKNIGMIRNSLLKYYRAIISGDEQSTAESLRLIRDFQQANAGQYLPSDTHREVEIFYMEHNFTALLFKVNLTLGVLALLFVFLRGKRIRRVNSLFHILLIGSLLVHTLSIALRTYIGGRLPFSNGYETMLLIAWCAMCIAVIAGRKIPVVVPFGYLLSGCTLLVAWLGMKNPQITPLVPVLSSPLLSIHVSAMMIAYTLLGFMMLNSFAAIVRMLVAGKGDRSGMLQHLERHRVYGLVCLYPAVLFLGAGIFTGAVWANVSWGRYWGWDPKEVWALITFLVYSLIIHQRSLKMFTNPVFFHIFAILAFLTVLITYFGVNYFLGGMHSYA